MDDGPASIIAQLASYDVQSLNDDPHARYAALSLSKKLSASLEDAETQAMALALAPMSNVAVRIAIDIDLFVVLAAQSSPVSSALLASTTRSDPVLALRLLRTCAGLHLVQQHDSDSGDLWSANAATRAMARPAMAAWHRMLWDMSLTAAIAAPPFFRAHRHRALEDPARGILQRTFCADADADSAPLMPYDVLRTMPALERDFNDAMAVGTGQPEPWFRLFPAEERLLLSKDAGDEPDTPSALLVDVAGGKGHDLQAFHEAFPGHGGQLVLQEQPRVIDSIAPGSLDPSITVQTHDFLAAAPQPVRGARAYMLRRVLHQWPDAYAVRILKGVREAMRPGYSTLLVYEAVLPEAGAARALCELDMCVLVFGGGMERSRAQWVALLREAGLEVVKFWQKHNDADGVIEAVASSS